jgi:hypothetical protein
MPTCYLGVHIASGRQPFTFTALDADLRLQAVGKGELADIIAFAAGQTSACAAVNAPSELNCGDMQRDEVRRRFSPPPPEGRWTNLRVAEYELSLQGAAVPRTPDTLGACPAWMRAGFNLYEQLAALDYQPYPHPEAALVWLETQTEAAFWSYVGKPLFTGGTLEGRLQRQLILFQEKLPVADPMDFFEEVTRFRLLNSILPLDKTLPDEELSAIMAAYIAWLALTQPESVSPWGGSKEGSIYLPRMTNQPKEKVYERFHVD